MKLKIEKLIYGGDGLARLPADEHGPGKTVFVPFVLESEGVEAKFASRSLDSLAPHWNALTRPRRIGLIRAANIFSAAEDATTSTPATSIS